MNTRAGRKRVDAQAAIERLDAIPQTLDVGCRVASGDRNLEGKPAILVADAERCLRPR